MDPLSLAASIAGLLALTESVLTSCYHFVGKVNSAAADVDRIIREAGGLKVILLDLKSLVDEGGSSKLPSVNSLCKEDGALTACFKSLEELVSKLAPSGAGGPMSLRRKLMWPFESKKVDEILANIQKQKPTLLLALMSENLDTTRTIQDSLEESKLLEKREKILNWLSRADPTTKHTASRQLHQPGSNHWILELSAFEAWKRTPGHTFWLHGIPGAGKTIICSTIIDHIAAFCKTRPQTQMAYYYFDFNDESLLRLGTFLQSIILQLSRQSGGLPDPVRSLYEQCDNGREMPGDGPLVSTLFDLLMEDKQTFIIIDALDECPKVERERFYQLITERIGHPPGRYNFLLTSRKEADIEEAMTEISQLYDVPIQSGDVNADVRLHVREFILGNKRLRKWPEELRSEIETSVVTGAEGM
jgi:ankyrin repeat domain-containing protein 50